MSRPRLASWPISTDVFVDIFTTGQVFDLNLFGLLVSVYSDVLLHHVQDQDREGASCILSVDIKLQLLNEVVVSH